MEFFAKVVKARIFFETVPSQGLFKNDVTGVEEEGDYPKLVTKSDIVGRRVHVNSDITTKKNYA